MSKNIDSAFTNFDLVALPTIRITPRTILDRLALHWGIVLLVTGQVINRESLSNRRLRMTQLSEGTTQTTCLT